MLYGRAAQLLDQQCITMLVKNNLPFLRTENFVIKLDKDYILEIFWQTNFTQKDAQPYIKGKQKTNVRLDDKS